MAVKGQVSAETRGFAQMAVPVWLPAPNTDGIGRHHYLGSDGTQPPTPAPGASPMVKARETPPLLTISGDPSLEEMSEISDN